MTQKFRPPRQLDWYYISIPLTPQRGPDIFRSEGKRQTQVAQCCREIQKLINRSEIRKRYYSALFHIDEIERICKHFNCSVDFIFELMRLKPKCQKNE